MTKEEAKKYLIDISYALGNMSVEYLTEKDGEKMREAIETLEQEPCEDAISRQAAIDLCERFDGCVPYSVLSSYGMLPPVTVEPKTGHWICTIEDWNKWTCSECGFCKRTDIHVSLGYNYCPNCGAGMESEGSDNQYNREKCYECCNKNKSVLDMPCCKCSAENDYVYFNAHDWEYESMGESKEYEEKRKQPRDDTRPYYANEWTPQDSLYVEQGMLYD